MYSGVPQAVLHCDCVTSSLLYPKSHSLMLGRGCCPSSSTLSSCTDKTECQQQPRTSLMCIPHCADGPSPTTRHACQWRGLAPKYRTYAGQTTRAAPEPLAQSCANRAQPRLDVAVGDADAVGVGHRDDQLLEEVPRLRLRHALQLRKTAVWIASAQCPARSPVKHTPCSPCIPANPTA